METSNSLKKEEKLVSSVQGVQRAAPWVLLLGVIFIAVNMRAPLTSVGPLIEMIRDHLQLSNTMVGMITTLPLLSFALFSPFVPKLAKRFGMETVLFLAVIFLTIGIAMRALSGSTVIILYAGTAILGLGIAACNVLLPSLVKREFPERIGLMTGIYSISMNLFGAIASGVSITIAVGFGFGWQGALGIWGMLSILGILCWIPQIKRGSGMIPAVGSQATEKRLNVWRSPLAWQVTLFMGLQSTLFYILVAWLPEILNDKGFSANQAGWLLSLMQLAVLPVTFIAPILAGRLKNQSPIVVIISISLLAGVLGLLYGSIQFTILWIVLLGIGAGFSFGLAMILFSLRTKNAQEAAELSGMAQSFGYLLAAIGPMLIGYLHDLTNGWTIPLLLLAGTAVLLFVVGLGAGRNRFVGD